MDQVVLLRGERVLGMEGGEIRRVVVEEDTVRQMGGQGEGTVLMGGGIECGDASWRRGIGKANRGMDMLATKRIGN